MQGEGEQAKQNFERAAELRSNGRPNVAGRLALAALRFGEGKYAAALALYQRALRDHPAGPPECRLGIAACLFRCSFCGLLDGMQGSPGTFTPYSKASAMREVMLHGFCQIACARHARLLLTP
jgi:tetratricopeptide (TPR) repeat protein